MKKYFFALFLIIPLMFSCGKSNDDSKPLKVKWVDMGTGVEWATQNLGAAEGYEYGYKYAWGSTRDGKYFSWENCPFCNMGEDGKPVMTKYNNPGKETLAQEHDAATMKLLGLCRIPSPADLEALFDESVFEWTWISEYIQDNGKIGYNEWNEPTCGFIVTNRNTGKRLFFPAGGIGTDNGATNSPGIKGAYWTNTQDSSDETMAKAFVFNHNTGDLGLADVERRSGLRIRAVRPKS